MPRKQSTNQGDPGAWKGFREAATGPHREAFQAARRLEAQPRQLKEDTPPQRMSAMGRRPLPQPVQHVAEQS